LLNAENLALNRHRPTFTRRGSTPSRFKIGSCPLIGNNNRSHARAGNAGLTMTPRSSLKINSNATNRAQTFECGQCGLLFLPISTIFTM
jgi:hypothetical protein